MILLNRRLPGLGLLASRALPLLLAAAMAGGCASPGSADVAQGGGGSQETLSPEAKLREQLSSGSFQTDAAIESIALAVDAAKAILAQLRDPTAKAGFEEAIDILDACGKDLAEHIEEPPSEAEIAAQFSAFDEQRIQAIEAGNDAIHLLNEASGIVDSLASDLPAELLDERTTLDTRLVEAVDDVAGAVAAYGGTVEIERDAG